MFIDPEEWAIIRDFGFAGVVTLFVLAILRGWLVPRRVLRDLVDDKKTELKNLKVEVQESRINKSEWQESSDVKDGTIATLVEQLDETLEAGKLAEDIAQALHRVAENETT